jgi:hypothetical protein
VGILEKGFKVVVMIRRRKRREGRGLYSSQARRWCIIEF